MVDIHTMHGESFYTGKDRVDDMMLTKEQRIRKENKKALAALGAVPGMARL